MTGAQAKKAAQEIKEIANGGKKGISFPVMSGVVQAGSIDNDNYTCSVALNVNNSAVTGGVLLNAVSMNNNGVILYPADNSNVWVAEIDGPGKYGLLKCSNLTKTVVRISATAELTITSGKVVMNGMFSFKNGSESLFNLLGDFMKVMAAAEAPAGTSGGPLITTSPVSLSTGIVPPGPIAAVISNLQTRLSNILS